MKIKHHLAFWGLKARRGIEQSRWFTRLFRLPWAAARAMRFPPFGREVQEEFVSYSDYQRFATIAMALRRIDTEQIPGALAECGVFEGHASRFIHRLAPERTYYLFDTFKGFDQRDVEPGSGEDARFRSTSVEAVLKRIGDTRNLEVRQGRVPETFAGLEAQRFAFVLLDMDVYPPTRAALEFFYARLAPGAYLMVHDYHNDESNWACRRAVDEFMGDKPEGIIEVADIWGSIIFRKERTHGTGAEDKTLQPVPALHAD
jgi:O-methyltransferase